MKLLLITNIDKKTTKFNLLEISKVFPISELTSTKRNRKELLENLLEIHLGYAAEPGLAASLCN